MLTHLQEPDRNLVSSRLNDVAYQTTVGCVNAAIDRGITRIKRNGIVEELVQTILGYAKIVSPNMEVGKTEVFDTIACRITFNYKGGQNFTISLEGNDELTSKIEIDYIDDDLLVNKTKIESQSLLVMVTSLLLKNSQDSNGQFVEVFTKS